MGQISGKYKAADQTRNRQAMLRSSEFSAAGAGRGRARTLQAPGAAAPVRAKRKGAAGLLLSLLKIGFAGFGGGCALIPVIEKEVVDDQKLVSKQEYNKDSLVACITPGALPVEISTGLGLKADGIRGMIMAALAIAFPGSFLTVLILALLSGADSALLAQIQCISIGLTAFISSLLLVYAKNAVKEARSGGRRHVRSTVVVIVGVFILTCGKTFSKLPFMNGHYLLGLSTIQVLGLAFFWIFYTKCERSFRRFALAAGLTAIYIACAGNWQLIPQQIVKSAVVLAMIVLSGLGLARGIRGDLKESGKEIDRDLAARQEAAERAVTAEEQDTEEYGEQDDDELSEDSDEEFDDPDDDEDDEYDEDKDEDYDDEEDEDAEFDEDEEYDEAEDEAADEEADEVEDTAEAEEPVME